MDEPAHFLATQDDEIDIGLIRDDMLEAECLLDKLIAKEDMIERSAQDTELAMSLIRKDALETEQALTETLDRPSPPPTLPEGWNPKRFAEIHLPKIQQLPDELPINALTLEEARALATSDPQKLWIKIPNITEIERHDKTKHDRIPLRFYQRDKVEDWREKVKTKNFHVNEANLGSSFLKYRTQISSSDPKSSSPIARVVSDRSLTHSSFLKETEDVCPPLSFISVFFIMHRLSLLSLFFIPHFNSVTRPIQS